MSVVTRFAPSPTGFLHIGGARTALFNWLFAQHHELYGNGGKYLLRIEDTDRLRSSQEAIDKIYASLSWLGLNWEGEAVSQFSRIQRHQEVALTLLEKGKAYNCYCSPEELSEMRENARLKNQPMHYDRRWRDRSKSDAPKGVSPVIRMKMPIDGKTVLKDLVQGKVEVGNDQLDDLILLRADGSPTYMLAAVVDDYDMAITHVIRGDDHLTNAFRQAQIYHAMGWPLPAFAHIPLIYGSDGSKLSKRHGALGVEAYKEMGFLPDALLNYLLRLGWGYKDEEFISRKKAVELFTIAAVGKSPSKFDFAKLINLNSHYLRNADNNYLTDIVTKEIQKKYSEPIEEYIKKRILNGMDGLKARSKTIVELSEVASIYYLKRPLKYTPEASELLTGENLCLLSELLEKFSAIHWSQSELELEAKNLAKNRSIKLGLIAQPLRAAITGKTASPSIFEVMYILGRDESIARLSDIAGIKLR